MCTFFSPSCQGSSAAVCKASRGDLASAKWPSCVQQLRPTATSTGGRPRSTSPTTQSLPFLPAPKPVHQLLPVENPLSLRPQWACGGGPEPLSFSGSGNPLGHMAPPALWVPVPHQPLGKGKRQEKLPSLFEQWLPLKLHLNEVDFAVHRGKGLPERGGPSPHPLSPSLLPSAFQLPVPWAGRPLSCEEPLPSAVHPSPCPM